MGHLHKAGLVDFVVESSWPVSAMISGVCLVVGYGLGPAVLPDLAGGPLLSLVSLLLAAAWALIALLKYRSGLALARRQEFPERLRRDPVCGALPLAEMLAANAKCEPVLALETPPVAGKWSVELLQSLAPARFAALCREFYAVKGLRSECPAGSADLLLYPATAGAASAMVRCLAATDQPVGVTALGELRAAMERAQVSKAFFMSGGRFTDGARAFAAPHRITLIDGAMLRQMLQRLPAIPRLQLLALATTGQARIPGYAGCRHEIADLAYRQAA